MTLVELLIVIAILGILATALYWGYTGYMERARDNARKSNLHNISLAMTTYLNDNYRVPNPSSKDNETIAINSTTSTTSITSSTSTTTINNCNKTLKSNGGNELTIPTTLDIKNAIWCEGGVVGESVKNEMGTILKQLPKDPKTQTRYKYYTDSKRVFYFILAELEIPQKTPKDNILNYKNNNNQERSVYYVTNYDTAYYNFVYGANVVDGSTGMSGGVGGGGGGGGGVGNQDQDTSGGIGGSITPTPPTFSNCTTGTIQGYNISRNINHGNTLSVTKTETGNPTNGSTIKTATARCNNGNISIENENATSFSCETNYHKEGNSCISNTQTCTTSSGTGIKTWNGSSYGSCVLNNCSNTSTYLEGGVCKPSIRDCSPLPAGATSCKETRNPSNGSWTISNITCNTNTHTKSGNICTPNRYIVKFNPAGGVIDITTKTIQHGQSVGTLPTPTKTNYNFDGWYTSETGGTKINSSTIVNSNVTYYARWISALPTTRNCNPAVTNARTCTETLTDPNNRTYGNRNLVCVTGYTANANKTACLQEYTITFNSLGGSTVANKKVATGNAIGELPVPTRNNENFVGWFIPTTYSNRSLGYKGLTKIDSSYIISKDTTLIAGFACSDGTSAIYKHSNGVTKKANTCAKSGYKYIFEGEINHIAIDKEDIQKVILSGSSRYMPTWAYNFTPNNIITTRVTDMSSLFYSHSDGKFFSFNENINDWDVSNVTNMYSMFQWALSFNQPLDKWDVSKVENMEQMFFQTTPFNNDSINSWKPINVTNVDGFMYSTMTIRQDLSGLCFPKISREPKDFFWKDTKTYYNQNPQFKPRFGKNCK